MIKSISTVSDNIATNQSWLSEDFSNWKPDIKVNSRKVFGLDQSLQVPAFSQSSNFVPEIDEGYVFDQETTTAILAGFMHDRRVLIQGYHGTGKSTHIEQIAARLNWPCIRVNLDSTISRMDLMGKDAIVLQNGVQITEFIPGILPWAMRRPVAICFDEYDAGRPDVMFVIQRILESSGKLTLLDQSLVLKPHKHFRLFATANTIGLGDSLGMYHGTQPINQGQLDRWQIVINLNYLSLQKELQIILSKCSEMNTKKGRDTLTQMLKMAHFTRQSMMRGDLSTVMSPRTVLTWAENYNIFKDLEFAFKISFYNRSDETERVLLKEEYQRCFATDLNGNPTTDGNQDN